MALYEEPEKPTNALEYDVFKPFSARELTRPASRLFHQLHRFSISWKVDVRAWCSFIKQYLGAPSSVDMEAVKSENEFMKKKNEELKKQLEDATKKVRRRRRRRRLLGNLLTALRRPAT